MNILQALRLIRTITNIFVRQDEDRRDSDPLYKVIRQIQAILINARIDEN